jgi:transcriptional accessory protein Tex/SPT6
MASSSKAPQNSKISFSMDDFDKALAAHDYHFEQGQTVRGVVIEHISDGAFVDIGVHQDGLVHISQLTHNFVDDPRKVVSPGDQVEVKVLKIDLEKNQIFLTMKMTALRACSVHCFLKMLTK